MERVLRSAATVLRPPPDLTISQWADEYRVLSAEASAEPGKWSTSRVEYLRGVMDASCDPEISTVVFMKSAQVGSTEIINNIIGYHIHQDPSKNLVAQQIFKLASNGTKSR